MTVPTDLNTLATLLRTQAETNAAIVLDNTVLPEATLESIRAAFELDDGENLTVSGVKPADIPEPSTAGELTIKVGMSSILKQKNAAMSLTFTAPGGSLRVVIVARMSSSWKFSESFDGLDIFPFKFLDTSGVHFVYTTFDQESYLWPGDGSGSIPLVAGLNFLSKVTFIHFANLRNLLGSLVEALTFNFYGPLKRSADQTLPVGTLRARLKEGTFKIGVGKLQLSLANPAVAVRIGASTDEAPVQEIDFFVEAVFQNLLQVTIGIPVDGAPFEVITAPLEDSQSVTRLIQELPGGEEFTTYIPAELKLKGIFDNVGLNNFSMIVATTPPKVGALGLSISTTEPWKVMSSLLELEKLSLEIETIDPTGFNWTRVYIAASASFLPGVFGDVKFAFTVNLERQSSWQVSSVSGAYYGSVSLAKIVNGLDSRAWVPSDLSDITFSDFGVIATRQKQDSPFNYSFSGSVEVAFPIMGCQLSSSLNLKVTKTPTGHEFHLGGALTIGKQAFTLSLDLGTPDSQLIATWKNEATPLGFGEIANAFGWTTMPELPEGLDLGLNAAEFIYDFNSQTVALRAHSVNYGDVVFASMRSSQASVNAGERVYVLWIDTPLDIKLKSLPVIGESLPADVGVERIQIAASSAELVEKDLDALKTLVKKVDEKQRLIPSTLTKGVTLAASLQLEGKREIVVPLKRPAKVEEPEPLPTEVTALAAPDYGSDAKWLTLKKTLGPVHLDKVGVMYQDSKLYFLLNAALSVMGLTLSVDGLRGGSPLTKFQPEFEISGLGVEYKNDAVEIGGAFLRTAKDRYDGSAVIRTKQFTLSALGSYMKLEGQPSIFIYAFLDYPLGGPAFFFVTGLAAGFGYNRKLIAPSIDNVANFPLVKQAVGGKQAAPDGILEALKALQEYVPPSVGDIFLAVGVRFNSFKLIDSFALLTMEFGNKFVVNLLGLSTAIIPTPEAGKSVTPLAQVQIAWKATFDPADGVLGVDARLTPNSYILSKDCHLSGGYAFYSWFRGDRAGDFVQTLGGYHPQFVAPPHYPKVPRLAFDWRVSNSLTIQGNAYYALTGSALMAGGYLEVLFKEGELRAWLKLQANFLIAWKPYHYDVELSVNVGASYTFNIDLLFTSVRITISVDVGARLHLWGPDFSGTAQIDISVISFSIGFGAGASQKPPPIKEWATFQQSFLPANDVCSISVKDGMVRKVETAHDERWIINPKQCSLLVNSAIPFKSAPSPIVGDGDLVPSTANVTFGIYPMAVTATAFKSTVIISVNRKGAAGAAKEFLYELIQKQLPAGLWAERLDTSTPRHEDAFLKNVPSGVEIRPRNEVTGGESATIAAEYSVGYYPSGAVQPRDDTFAYEWQPPGGFTAVPDAGDVDARRKFIEANVGTNKRRNALLKELDMTINVKMSGDVIAGDFISPPQIGNI